VSRLLSYYWHYALLNFASRLNVTGGAIEGLDLKFAGVDKSRETHARILLVLFVVSCLKFGAPSLSMAAASDACHVGENDTPVAAGQSGRSILPDADCKHCPTDDADAGGPADFNFDACAIMANCAADFDMAGSTASKPNQQAASAYTTTHDVNSTAPCSAQFHHQAVPVGPPLSLNIRFCRYLI
jgi:hypothetical protein